MRTALVILIAEIAFIRGVSWAADGGKEAAPSAEHLPLAGAELSERIELYTHTKKLESLEVRVRIQEVTKSQIIATVYISKPASSPDILAEEVTLTAYDAKGNAYRIKPMFTKGGLLKGGTSLSVTSGAPFIIDRKAASVITEVEPGIYGKKLRFALFNYDPGR